MTDGATPWLSLQAGTTASVYLWLPEGRGEFSWEQDGPGEVIALLVDDAPGASTQPCPPGQTVALDSIVGAVGRIVQLRLTADAAPVARRLRLTSRGVYPFLLPGPGIVPSHFPRPEPALALGQNGPFTLWYAVPADQELLTLQALLPAAALPALLAPDGSPRLLVWKMRRCAYRVAQLVVGEQPGWWGLSVEGCADRARLTSVEGLPLFLRRPPQPFPYARLEVRVTGPDGPLPARVAVYRDDRLACLRDLLPDEQGTLFVPPGAVTVQATAGPHFGASALAVETRAELTTPLALRLPQLLTPEPGWYCGDHHMHSWFEDGGQPVDTVVRAARAQGLNYLFLTDIPEPLLAAGLQRHDVPGQFLALPGQEVVNPEVHCNALNTSRTITCPEYGDNTPGYPGPAEWLADVAEQRAQGQPVTLMLDHPSHRPEVAARQRYFRSWWVADEHPEIRLVENFDLPSWYDRLNRGRRLTGLWTTDTHDVALLPPGERRTYVHIPSALTPTTLLAALEEGRCFNTRVPGALLYLTINGAQPGETAMRDDGTSAWSVQLRCRCTRPLERLDLVCRGQVVRSWQPHGAQEVDIAERLELDDWVLALAYAVEEPTPEREHSGTPLDVAGCIAFTNPIWLTHAPG